MSTIKCSDPKPGEVLKKSATSRESDSEDPVFLPRDRPYTFEEESHLLTLIPLKVLPVSLLPTPKYPRPPCMHYGWVLTNEVKARLMKKAHEAQVVVRRFAYVPCSEEEDPTGCRKVYGDIDEFFTLTRAARVILEELGIVLPSHRESLSAIGLLDTKGKIDTEWALTLFSNLTLDDRLPSANDIARIRAAFGLTVEPRWWPDIRFDWVIRDD